MIGHIGTRKERITFTDAIKESEYLKANPLCHLCQREGYYRKANHVIRTKRDDATIALCERHYADYLKYN